MRKVAIIANFAYESELYEKTLKSLFQEKIDICTYSSDMDIVDKKIEADVILISLYTTYLELKKYIHKDTAIIISNTTITLNQYEEIKKIPMGTHVLLVDHGAEVAMEKLMLLEQLGLTQYDFIPVYPGKKNIPNEMMALKFGARNKVPSCVKKTLDVGCPVLDGDTISDLAVKIGHGDLLSNDRFVEYFKSLKNVSNNSLTLRDRASSIESKFFELLNVIDQGIIATGPDGIIINLNKKACQILNLSEKDIGSCIQKVIEHNSMKKAIKNKEGADESLIRINDTDVSFQVVPINRFEDIKGFLIIINKFKEKEEKQHKLRSQLVGKGHHAKYTFDDIIGESEIIDVVRNKAKKMAKSDSSILITGETGVGKEIFAQAIHNHSKRKNYQFVAVNCAAINDNLLESELFGYEEGAFTGAKKGGKMGLFELAHQGTIFLDEIGEMPLNLQTRLLRVIQEREVMRIGGDYIIQVDIRIIAATNKNLRKLVEENKFRDDLFYRLNVLPLMVPPLRARENDVLVLFEDMRRKMDVKLQFSAEAKKFLLSYVDICETNSKI